MSEYRITNGQILNALSHLGVGAVTLAPTGEMSQAERLYAIGALNAAVDALMVDEPENTAVEQSEHLGRGYAHVVSGLSTGKDAYSVKGIDRRGATNGWAMFAARTSMSADVVAALDDLALGDECRIGTATPVHASVVLSAAFTQLGCADAFLGGLTPEERIATYELVGSLLADVMGNDVGGAE